VGDPGAHDQDQAQRGYHVGVGQMLGEMGHGALRAGSNGLSVAPAGDPGNDQIGGIRWSKRSTRMGLVCPMQVLKLAASCTVRTHCHAEMRMLRADLQAGVRADGRA
jgi:hypothetical protein